MKLQGLFCEGIMKQNESLPFSVTVLTFRTANKNKGSIYEIGILIANKGEEVIAKTIRVNPNTKTFSLKEENGGEVTIEDLRTEPTFDKIWEDIEPHIANKIIALHYAKFHEIALLTVLKRYNIDKPNYKLIDIYELAMRMNLDVLDFKFDTIAAACDVWRPQWDSLSKVQAIYSILCQFYNKKPSLFKPYVSKNPKTKNNKKVVQRESEKITMPEIETTSPIPNSLSRLPVSSDSNNTPLFGCLIFPIVVIVIVVFFTYSCGYDSDSQKSIREENAQQEQTVTPIVEEQPKRDLPQGRGYSDVGRQTPIYYDTIGKIAGDIHGLESIPIYASAYGDNVIGYVNIGVEVSVKSQDLQHRGYGQYTGRLLVERTDNHRQFYIDVYNYIPAHFKE